MWASFYSRTLTPSAAVVHKVKIHFFSIFFRASIVRSAVRHQGGRLLRQLCCWVGVSAQRTHHAKTTSQDSAPIKFDWLLTQESDWIIWTNQKITLIIFWLVKNGKDWNPAIPLVKRIFLVPDHIWPKTIKGQPALTHVIRNYVLLLVVPPLCLWWVTHSDESAQAQNSSRATTTLVSQPPHSTVLAEYLTIACDMEPLVLTLNIWHDWIVLKIAKDTFTF